MQNDREILETIITSMDLSQYFTPTSIPQPTSNKSNMTVITIFVLFGILAIAGIVSYLYCKCYSKKMNRKIQQQLPEPFTTASPIRKDNNGYYGNENEGIENNIENQASIDDINVGSVNEDRLSQDSERSINSDIEPMLKKNISAKASASMPHNLISAIFRSHSSPPRTAYRNEASDGTINSNSVDKSEISDKHPRHSSAKQSRQNSVLD